MSRFPKSLSLLAFSLVMACAPVYQTTRTYHPPQDGHGRQCVAQCLSAKYACGSLCRDRYATCREESRDVGDRRYQDALDEYEEALGEWRRCRERSPGHPDCSEYNRPERPQRMAYQRSGACNESCPQCDTDYDACYTACGGSIEAKTQCLRHCSS